MKRPRHHTIMPVPANTREGCLCSLFMCTCWCSMSSTCKVFDYYCSFELALWHKLIFKITFYSLEQWHHLMKCCWESHVQLILCLIVPHQQFLSGLDVSQCLEVEDLSILQCWECLLLLIPCALDEVHPVLVVGVWGINVPLHFRIFVDLEGGEGRIEGREEKMRRGVEKERREWRERERMERARKEGMRKQLTTLYLVAIR